MGKIHAFPELPDGLTSRSAAFFALPRSWTGQAQLLRQVQGVFMLVDHYILLCRFDSDPSRLEPVVEDLITLAARCFSSAAHVVSDFTLKLHTDHERCLRDLKVFLGSLRGGCPVSQQEISHAMDDVVVFCALLDAEWGQRTTSSGPRSDPLCRPRAKLTRVPLSGREVTARVAPT